ncbi:MAG: aminotransferase class I/II-fold pyridoxal phosphate-dependent enzyme [Acidobacteria bacterium]|nr:aminotransferase class I/II-fold pyridoxal phosphate-dependent enzyme [Acidobacteriota bacterium]
MRANAAARRTANFTESVIREMTRLALEHRAVNLAQGFPDFPAPPEIKAAAQQAVCDDINQYAITWGAKNFRDALVAKYRAWYGLEIDPEREITVCCGSTEGMIASLLATVDPGDEVITFEPFYENYGPDTELCGAARKLVTLYPPDWHFDKDALRRAFSSRTRGIILNTPNNPTGKVFRREELEFIAGLCHEFDALAYTDEIYEHILYGDAGPHHPMITLDGMRDRAVLVNSMSKTYSVTGWRVGWVIASPALTDPIRKVHDFLTVGAAAPLQQAGVTALASPREYYARLKSEYQHRRDLLLGWLQRAGFHCYIPDGAYYIMTDISGFGADNDVEFVRRMIVEAEVAAVPGSSFYADPARGARQVRFCFCKKDNTLQEAGERLVRWTRA